MFSHFDALQIFISFVCFPFPSFPSTIETQPIGIVISIQKNPLIICQKIKVSSEKGEKKT